MKCLFLREMARNMHFLFGEIVHYFVRDFFYVKSTRNLHFMIVEIVQDFVRPPGPFLRQMTRNLHFMIFEIVRNFIHLLLNVIMARKKSAIDLEIHVKFSSFLTEEDF